MSIDRSARDLAFFLLLCRSDPVGMVEEYQKIGLLCVSPSFSLQEQQVDDGQEFRWGECEEILAAVQAQLMVTRNHVHRWQQCSEVDTMVNTKVMDLLNCRHSHGRRSIAICQRTRWGLNEKPL
jgi:hypothetical protein